MVKLLSSPERRTFMLFDMHEDRDTMPVIGTAFGFQRHGLLPTAAHVISD